MFHKRISICTMTRVYLHYEPHNHHTKPQHSPIPECPPHRIHGCKCGHILTERVKLNLLDSEVVLEPLFCLPLFSALITTTSGIAVKIARD